MPIEAPDYYTGFAQEEVETLLSKFKEELPKVVQQYSTSGDSVLRIQRDQLRIDIKGCQLALKRFDPDTYGKRKGRVSSSRIVGHLAR